MADHYVSDTGPFVIVPEWVMNLPVSHGAFRLYALIARYADYDTGRAFPARSTLAKRLDVSSDTIDRWLRELAEHGAVEVERRRTNQTNQTNLYRVIRVMPEGDRTVTGGRKDTATRGRKDTATPGRTDAAQTRTTIDREPSTETVTVFEAWLESTGKSKERTRLDERRRRIIRKALELYPVADLVEAVTGWRYSAFHRGENDHGKVYNDLGLLLRDADHIERFRDLARSKPSSVKEFRPYDQVHREPCGKCDDGWVIHEDEKGRSYARPCECQTVPA